MALVVHEAISYTDPEDFFRTNAPRSIKNSLVSAGYTVTDPGGPGGNYRATHTGEGVPLTITGVAGQVIDVRGNLRLVRPGWRLKQGPPNERILDVLLSTGQVKVEVGGGSYGAGAADAHPDFPITFRFDLDTVTRQVHFRAYRVSTTEIGAIGDLVGTTSLQLPPTDPFTGWLYVDASGLLMIVKHGVGQYRIAHCGTFYPARAYKRSARSKLSATQGGPSTAINIAIVEASSAGFEIGMTVFLTEAISGIVNKRVITGINVVTGQIDLDVATSEAFTIGSHLSRDPHPYALAGSLQGPFGPLFTATAPDNVELNPGTRIGLLPDTFTKPQNAAFASDVEGAFSTAAMRLLRFGQGRTEQPGLLSRYYEFAAIEGVAPPADETLLTIGREQVRVFKDIASGRILGARVSGLGLFLADH